MISSLVDFDWNDYDQVQYLLLTAIVTGTVMMICVGVVDLSGKILDVLYLNSVKLLSKLIKTTANENSNASQLACLKNIIVFISPQPAPITSWPLRSQQTCPLKSSNPSQTPIVPKSEFDKRNVLNLPITVQTYYLNQELLSPQPGEGVSTTHSTSTLASHSVDLTQRLNISNTNPIENVYSAKNIM